MSNMSYCRFENTVNAMRDCINSLDDSDKDMSSYERIAKAQFIRMCIDVAENYANSGAE